MSPPQKGINWTLIAVVLSAASTLVYIGHTTGRIEQQQQSTNERLDARDAKDAMQDMRLLNHDISIAGMATDVAALKEGRYEPKRPVPVFPNKFNSTDPQ